MIELLVPIEIQSSYERSYVVIVNLIELSKNF